MKSALAVLLFLAGPAHAAIRARDLSVEELAGQLFMIAIDTDIAAVREADIRAGRLGGAMLRWDKFTGGEARAFSAKMREWSMSAPHSVPFWLATDHEGGPLFTQRRYGVTAFPGSMALGASGSEELTRGAARAQARELRALGLDITFAPVLDVNSNPDSTVIGLRSFGEDPELVARLGRAALAGYKEGGILSVVKHFPGHGDAAVDSHFGLPVSTKTMAELEAVELKPFRAAFAAGAPAVMPAHMAFPALGTPPGRSVTLSSAALTDFLRGRMGFRGLVFSDSLDMGAIAGVRGSSEAAVDALEAGVDVLMLGKADFPAAFAAVVEAVNGGRVPRARLERSVDKILAAKRRMGAGPRSVDDKTLESHRALARRSAERSVTLLRDSGLLPLKLEPSQTLGLILARNPRYDREAAYLANELAKRHARLEVVDIAELYPSTAAVEGALARVSSASVLVLATDQHGMPLPPNTVELMRRAIAGGAPVLALSLMNPYDLAYSTGAAAAIAIYGMTPPALEAAVKIMFGEISARGRLPVAVPGAAERGAGIVDRKAH